jgi:hypothetical protein
MPYIPKEDRQHFEEAVNLGLKATSSGELNYILTRVCVGYLNRLGMKRYSTMNDILGALEGAKLEFYRKVVSPYEDGKETDNGTVYL